MFGMGLRSRMNRMGHPFEWSGRKRRGSGQTAAADPYDQYFRDEVDFPHFGSTWDAFNKRQPTERGDRSGFFDYLPSEFRQYIPDDFGYNRGGRHGRGAPPQGQYYEQQQQPPPTAPPQQQQPHQPSASRSNLCDAAIQTEDLGAPSTERPSQSNGADHPPPQSSHSPNSSASHSAPHESHNYTNTSANGPNAYANASASTPYGHSYSQSPSQQPYGWHPQQPPHSAQGDNSVRNVPIFIEGSNVPVNNQKPAASSPCKQRPEPFACKEPFEQQSQPNPESGDDGPPQTPHTIDCINKIQAIQRNVLELMCAVEQFGGKRGDKEYAYLDEMLTRNLLKLDTIDTNGKDSIRMARKEAIKCIQASIAVLEAKADLSLNEKRDNESANKDSAGDAKPDDEQTAPAEEEAMELSKTEVIALPAAPEKMEATDSTGNDANDATKTSDNEVPKDVQENIENIKIDDGDEPKKDAEEDANAESGATAAATDENKEEKKTKTKKVTKAKKGTKNDGKTVENPTDDTEKPVNGK